MKNLFTTSLLAASLAVALAAQTNSNPAPQPAPAKPAAPAAKAAPFRFPENKLPPRVERYYATLWGIDSLGVKSVESGELIRFSYRVVDPAKATTINDKSLKPALIDEQRHVSLVIPTLEKVGQLRQSSTPEAGKSYWMAFSNAGGYVKKGDRVRVEIGNFKADGLVVQ